AASNLPGNVSVLLGNDDRIFGAPLTFTAGNDPRSVAVGDFNGDGRPDLAVANAADVARNLPGSVSVLLGNGDGTFQAALTVTAGNNPRSVGVGDFNRDGVLDLVVVDGDSHTTSVLLGNGDRSFQAPLNVAAGSYVAV